MDLKAFIQIEDLEKIAADNGIEVPRLRGYRLMCTEKPYSQEYIEDAVESNKCWIYEKAITHLPKITQRDRYEVDGWGDRLERKYLIRKRVTCTRIDGSEFSYLSTVGFRWDRLHGKPRKRLKLMLKQSRKAITRNLETFNRYAGREDVLYIHARIGGGNWGYYGGSEIAKQPWFLEKVDDGFDCTYCDIYAKIGATKNEIRATSHTNG